jgi:exonuclease III
MNVLTIATPNINGLESLAQIATLDAFIRTHDINIILLQVTKSIDLPSTHYRTYFNIGTTRRGTAIVAREGVELSNIAMVSSGRAIVVEYDNLKIVNIYAPSGTAKRSEREDFFNRKLPSILGTAHKDILMGGDFNCVLGANDVTGRNYFSRALANLMQGYALHDAWQVNTRCNVYTHYTGHGAS